MNRNFFYQVSKVCIYVHIVTALVFIGSIVQGAALAQTNETELVDMDCAIPQNTRKIRPGPESEKTKVSIGFFLIDLKEINDVQQTYSADIFFNINWNDPRLSEESLGKSLKNCVFDLEEIWHPLLLDVNRNSGGNVLPDIVYIDEMGNVNHKMRYVGQLSSDLDFTDFPFDKQVLHFMISAYGPDIDNIVFEQDKELSGRRNNFSVEGWEIELLEAITKSERIQTESGGFARYLTRIDFRFTAERDKKYYLLNVITPLCLIVLMAWAVFWIPPTAIGPQIGLSTATVFTLIAYRFSLSYQLPRVSYFTRIDKFVLFSTILVFVALGTAILTSKIASDGDEERAESIEKWARYIYILAFMLIVVFAFLI